jgi:hypothetical protein
MYLGADGQCLSRVRDTHEFARLKGVKSSDIDREVAKAETRIRAGLTLFEYLGWSGVATADLPPCRAPDVRSDIHHHLLISLPMLLALANPSLWAEFCEHSGTDLRLAQVLLLSEAQVDELQQFHPAP